MASLASAAVIFDCDGVSAVLRLKMGARSGWRVIQGGFENW